MIVKHCFHLSMLLLMLCIDAVHGTSKWLNGKRDILLNRVQELLTQISDKANGSFPKGTPREIKTKYKQWVRQVIEFQKDATKATNHAQSQSARKRLMVYREIRSLIREIERDISNVNFLDNVYDSFGKKKLEDLMLPSDWTANNPPSTARSHRKRAPDRSARARGRHKISEDPVQRQGLPPTDYFHEPKERITRFFYKINTSKLRRVRPLKDQYVGVLNLLQGDMEFKIRNSHGTDIGDASKRIAADEIMEVLEYLNTNYLNRERMIYTSEQRQQIRTWPKNVVEQSSRDSSVTPLTETSRASSYQSSFEAAGLGPKQLPDFGWECEGAITPPWKLPKVPRSNWKHNDPCVSWVVRYGGDPASIQDSPRAPGSTSNPECAAPTSTTSTTHCTESELPDFTACPQDPYGNQNQKRIPKPCQQRPRDKKQPQKPKWRRF